MSDFIDDHFGVFAFLLACVITCAAIGLGVFLMRETCAAMTAEIGMESRWSMMGGCQVHDVDRWIPLENWRVME